MDRHQAYKTVRRWAQRLACQHRLPSSQDTGVPGASGISPHSLRHTFITLALDAGAALRDVQDAAGHDEPRTARRYDRARGALNRSPGLRRARHLSIGQAPAKHP